MDKSFISPASSGTVSTSQKIEEKNESHNLDLSIDVLKIIFSYLAHPVDVLNVSLTCKTWYEAAACRLNFLKEFGPQGMDLDAAAHVSSLSQILFEPFLPPSSLLDRSKDLQQTIKAASRLSPDRSAIVITFLKDVEWQDVLELSKRAVTAGILDAAVHDSYDTDETRNYWKPPLEAGTYVCTRSPLKETKGRVGFAEIEDLQNNQLSNTLPHTSLCVVTEIYMRILKKPINKIIKMNTIRSEARDMSSLVPIGVMYLNDCIRVCHFYAPEDHGLIGVKKLLIPGNS